MEKVLNIKLDKLSAFGECKLFHHGNLRDYINKFNIEFLNNKVYGIIGEFGDGGAALTAAISGKIDIDSGEVYINGEKKDYKVLKELSCYIGEDGGLSKRFGFKPMTVREQIEYGIKNQMGYSLDVKDIKQKFGLSDERFNREIKYFSGEKWKASMAIGYAMGKSIYCYPLMNSKDLIHLEEHIRLCSNALLDVGAIIIIPTCSEKILSKIFDKGECEFIYLFDK